MWSHVRYTGYSLVELMMVVTIIGFLATMAIPKYQEYSVRARLTEAVQILSSARINIAEYFIAESKLPTVEQAGVATGQQGIVAGLAYKVAGTAGVITATIDPEVSGEKAWTLSMVAQVVETTEGKALSWRCRTGNDTGANPVPARLLPAACRKEAPQTS